MKPELLTKAGNPRVNAPGAGRPPKNPAEKVRSRQIRVHLHTFAKLSAASGNSGRPITEIVGDLVERMPVPPACAPGRYPEGYEQ